MERETTISARAVRTAHPFAGHEGLRDWALSVSAMERWSTEDGMSHTRFAPSSEFTLAQAHAAGDPDALEAARLLERIAARAAENPHGRAERGGL